MIDLRSDTCSQPTAEKIAARGRGLTFHLNARRLVSISD
jgi:hypothetical protein